VISADCLKYDSVVMPSRIRTAVLSMLQQDVAPPSMLSQMDVEFGQTFANAVHVFAKRHAIAVDDINLIGSGGQLVSLIGRPPKGRYRSNMVLGERSCNLSQDWCYDGFGLSNSRTGSRKAGRASLCISSRPSLTPFYASTDLHHNWRHHNWRLCPIRRKRWH
jgi:hypothetical protein